MSFWGKAVANPENLTNDFDPLPKPFEIPTFILSCKPNCVPIIFADRGLASMILPVNVA